MKAKETIRIDKYLSSMGITSRRNVENFLRFNVVTVAGKRITEHGQRIELPSTVTIGKKTIETPEKKYLMLNKPKGYITTLSDEFGRKNVTSLLKIKERVFPIGRLDRDTHGLLLFTNDGDLTNKLIHPRYHVGKIYRLTIRGTVSTQKIEKLENGVMLEEGVTKETRVKIVSQNTKETVLELEIFEGRKRQIRRMCEELKLPLLDLQRIQFGPLKLGTLKVGQIRELTKSEIKSLYSKKS